jgi:hypothetical protein
VAKEESMKKETSMHTTRRFVLLAAWAALGLATQARAANTWDAGGGANDNWDYDSGGGVYANWDNDALPASTADVTIQNVAAAGNSISLNGNRTVNSLTLNQTASQDFTIDNNTLTVTSGRITRNTGSLGRHDLTATILLGAAGEFVNNATYGTSHRLGLWVVDDGPAAYTVTYRGAGAVVYGASTYGGASLVQGGTLALNNTASTIGSALNSPSWTVVSGTLSFGNNTGNAAQDNGTSTFGRIGNTAGITLNASTLNQTANGNATGDNATERFGLLTFGTGRSTLQARRNSTGEATLLPSGFSRDGATAGTRGTVFIDQTTSQLLATYEFIKGTSYAGLTTIGGGGSRATDDSIVPYMVVDNAMSTTANDRPDSFVRVDAVTGLTALVAADYATDINAVNGDGNDNVRINLPATTNTMTSSTTVNALVIDNSNATGTSELAGNAGTILTVKSGAVLGGNTGGANAGTKLSVPTLAFGSAEGFLSSFTGGGSGFDVTSAITGNNGLTLHAGNSMDLTGNNSGLSGPVTVNTGTLLPRENGLNTGTPLRVRSGATVRPSAASGGVTLTVPSVSGAGTLEVGNQTGAMYISGTPATGLANFTLLSGGSISPGDCPQLLGATLSTGTLTLGNYNSGTPAGNLVVRLYNGTLNIDLASPDYFDSLALTTAQTTKNVTLTLSDGGSNPGATLAVNLGFAPAVGSTFKIVDVAGTNAVSGKFSNSGDTVTASYGGKNYKFDILYNSSLGGGDGNDIVLRAQPSASGTVFAIR